MIRIKQISKSFGSLMVLSEVTCFLGLNQKIALVGPNGAGKSTLLKIISGIEESDSGKIEVLPRTSIGYLPQEAELDSKETIESFLKNFVGIEDLEKKMHNLEKNLNASKKMEEYSNLQQLYSRINGYSFEHRIKTVLTGFGLGDISLNKKISFLSGGQKTKVLLSGILLKGVDVLLLDEPTNNLDLPALIWLENFLINSKATCLIVSHDQKFLDNVTSKVFELDKQTHELSIYTGNYSNYLEIKMKETRRQKKLYQSQQEELKRLKDSIVSKKSWAQQGAKQIVSDKDKYCRGMRRDRSAKIAKNAKTIEKRIIQMDTIEKLKEGPLLSVLLSPQKSKEKHSIKLEDVVAGYENGFKLGSVELEIPYGSRIGIFGQNGAGKSTLLKIIAGELMPLKGKVVIGSSLKIGNLMQEHENLLKEKSPFQFLTERAKLSEQDIYHLLSKFQFEDREIKRPIKELSPGYRVRLLLAFFAANSVNVLILDEPTNHLDVEANEALREALSGYSGTEVVVSHDRYFLEQIKLTSSYVIENNKLIYQENYDFYIEKTILQAKHLLRSLKF